ncbi:hypothetical protein [Roseiterribacter gracilis]
MAQSQSPKSIGESVRTQHRPMVGWLLLLLALLFFGALIFFASGGTST